MTRDQENGEKMQILSYDKLDWVHIYCVYVSPRWCCLCGRDGERE